MNSHYTPLYTSTEITTRIDELAKEVLHDHASGTPPLFVALLRGAAPFASRLMFALARINPEFHPDLDYMMISTYGDRQTASQPVIVTDLAPTTEVAGRCVIIVDDVIDHGVTSDYVRDELLDRGASSVKLAVLGSKTTPNRESQANYVGFDCGDKWLVGMGLDDAQAGHEHYRWLDEIWEINKQ